MNAALKLGGGWAIVLVAVAAGAFAFQSGGMTIHVINPNSLRNVTEGIEGALAPMRSICPVAIRTHTLADGPPGIETAEHIEQVVAPLLKWANAVKQDATALVVACFSDPGVVQLRQATGLPVFGIGAAAVLTALQTGGRFGTISIQPGSIPRHMAALEAMGIASSCAGDLALSMGVRELAEENQTRTRLREVGTVLRDAHGARVLILGCAGMAQYRAALERDLGLPVIDPCQAATAMAIGALALGQATEGKTH